LWRQTLILIKSKSLLPQSELSDDEKSAIGDLELRLELHKIFKDAGLLVKELFGQKLFLKQEKSRLLFQYLRLTNASTRS
jgi:hypothetical protein